MKLVKIPAIDPDLIRQASGADLNEPVRRRPLGFRRLGAGFGAQEEAELRSKGRL